MFFNIIKTYLYNIHKRSQRYYLYIIHKTSKLKIFCNRKEKNLRNACVFKEEKFDNQIKF
jgi:hypothetical protein